MSWICTECLFTTNDEYEADKHAEDHIVVPREDYYNDYYTNKKPEATKMKKLAGTFQKTALELKKIGEKPGVTVVPWAEVDVADEPIKTPFTAGRFTAGWTGNYPNLCSGKWIIVVDYRPFILPHDRQTKPMNTYGTYQTWSFGPGWDEEWDSYDGGLEFPEWLAENSEWLLAAFDANDVEKTWVNARDFYNAVSNNDWRHSSCGGCI